MSALLLRYEGDGEFKPANAHWAKTADRDFTVGELYSMQEQTSTRRSMNSHNHYFATLHDLWQTLPEMLQDEYPTHEHLRKKALIRTGWAEQRDFVCTSKAEAERFAKYLRAGVDDYTIVIARGAVVREMKAKSQSLKAMGKEDFQQSKDDVLAFAEALIHGDR